MKWIVRAWLWALFFFGGLVAQTQPYAWPTDAGRVLTSSFGEYRPDHFHMGLDFKTWGREGYGVYALADGFVSRIKTSPTGYGKSLYFKLDDGRVAVYGHLQAYADRLMPFLEEEQLRQGRYAVDAVLPRNLFRVRRGDFLGFTGSTGNGQPHLHVELRDPSGLAINPLAYFPVMDTRTPVLMALAATPLHNEARVNGLSWPGIWVFEPVAPGRYRIADTLDCSGVIGLSVRAYDQADGAYNRFAPYITRLWVDDVLLFAVRYDAVGFGETEQVEIDRDFWLRSQGQGDFQKLYRDAGNSLSLYHPDYGKLAGSPVDSLTAVLSPGLHAIRIEAEDYRGNRAVGEAMLRWGDVPAVSKPSPVLGRQPADSLAAPLAIAFFGTKLGFTVHGGDSLQEPPVLLVRSAPWRTDVVPLYPLQGQGCFGLLDWESREGGLVTFELRLWDREQGLLVHADTLDLAWITPMEGGVLRSADGRCRLEAPPGAVRRPLIAGMKRVAVDSTGDWAYAFYPRNVRFLRPLSLRWVGPLGAVLPGMGLGRVARERRAWVCPLPETPGTWDVAVSRPATYALVRDTTAPSIVAVTPAKEAVLDAGRPWIRVVYADSLSGVSGEENVRIAIDGRPLIVEPVPHAKTLVARPFEALSPGEHQLTIWLRDNAGNETRRQQRFFIR